MLVRLKTKKKNLQQPGSLTIVIMKRQRNSYTVKEKCKAVELVCHTSNKFAAKTYFLDLTMLGQWVKSFSQDNLSNKNSRKVGFGHHALFPEEEAQLYEWIMELRKEGLTVNYSSIKMKMAEIMKLSAGLAQDKTKKLAINNFKFSQHWFIDLEDKLLKFQQFVIRLRQKNDYLLGMIANMDKTPVWFDMMGNLTVNPRGMKMVHVRTTGNDKN
ncbi:34613_t:CDS:2 [Gigaspora margarita]|uniref:34613_t:CDS:1 n=1 Tax=Gigaspora margarita TaxID=4874 RepID=A0ABN7VY45_GIGMA|nr:34613_t:CDS:2 [Gigaspora margarita]